MSQQSTQSGYSYKITITAEELYPSSNFAGGTTPQAFVMNPPQIKSTRSFSASHGQAGRFASWSFRKIVEPRYDGIGEYTGTPVNFPDMISEHHVIGILKNLEDMVKPTNLFLIQQKGTSNST